MDWCNAAFVYCTHIWAQGCIRIIYIRIFNYSIIHILHAYRPVLVFVTVHNQQLVYVYSTVCINMINYTKYFLNVPASIESKPQLFTVFSLILASQGHSTPSDSLAANSSAPAGILGRFDIKASTSNNSSKLRLYDVEPAQYVGCPQLKRCQLCDYFDFRNLQSRYCMCGLLIYWCGTSLYIHK